MASIIKKHNNNIVIFKNYLGWIGLYQEYIISL